MKLSNDLQRARAAAGWRERFAMEHGNRSTIYIGGEKCIKFTYSTKEKYQDANGATFNTARGVWVN